MLFRSKISHLGFEKNGDLGNLIINFDIIFPNSLDEQRKNLLSKLLPKRKLNTSINNGVNVYTLEKYKEELNTDDLKNREEYMDNQPECRTQ